MKRKFSPHHAIYQYILEFLVSQPSPAEVMHFDPTPAMQMRVAELLEKNRMGALTAGESAEFDEYLRINHLITMLKCRLPNITANHRISESLRDKKDSLIR